MRERKWKIRSKERKGQNIARLQIKIIDASRGFTGPGLPVCQFESYTQARGGITTFGNFAIFEIRYVNKKKSNQSKLNLHKHRMLIVMKSRSSKPKQEITYLRSQRNRGRSKVGNVTCRFHLPFFQVIKNVRTCWVILNVF